MKEGILNFGQQVGKELVAGSVIGFLLGCGAVYFTARYFLKKARAQAAEKKFKDLVTNQYFTETLSSKELTAWFREHQVEFTEKTKMIITYLSDEVLSGLGYKATIDFSKDNSLLQFICDNNAKKVYKIRLVTFANISSNLQAKLIENNGMLVVTE